MRLAVLLWIVAALVVLAVAIPLVIWGASALWVRIVSRRWDATCADDERRT